ncbi:MAG: hypothetical protein AB1426_03690 [Bacillota bacterium]
MIGVLLLISFRKLKRYWGVREGSANPKGTVVPREGRNVPHERKTLADVAEALGETEKNLKRLLKLNDLIPELQQLVSRGKLSFGGTNGCRSRNHPRRSDNLPQRRRPRKGAFVLQEKKKSFRGAITVRIIFQKRTDLT